MDFPYGGDPVYRISLFDKNVAALVHVYSLLQLLHVLQTAQFTIIIAHLTNRTVYLLPLFYI